MRRRNLLVGAGVGALAFAVGGGAFVETSHADGSLDPPSDQKLQSVLGRKLEPRGMREDLTFLVDTLLEVAVNPFAVVSHEQFVAMRSRIDGELRSPLDVRAFWLRIAPLFASLHDGHVSTNLADLFYAEATRNGGIIPFALQFTRDGAYFSRHPNEIPVGSRVTAINGIGIRSLTSELLATVSAPNLETRLAFAGFSFYEFAFARFGMRTHHDVSFTERGSDRRRVVRLPSLTVEELNRRDAHAPRPVDYRYFEIENGTVGVIDYRSCRDLERFKTFLRDTFTRIRADSIRALVIDIRRNGGGSDSLNDELWQYAADRPFEQGNAMTVKVSHRLKTAYGFAGYAKRYLPTSWFAPDGSVIDYRFPDALTMQRPRANDLRYHGPVYLLVGPQTFSSALSCATAAKTFGLATIVGESPGQPVQTNGEVVEFFAPHSAIGAHFPTKFFRGPRPEAAGARLEPDVVVRTTPDDIRNGNDPVLAYVIRRVRRST